MSLPNSIFKANSASGRAYAARDGEYHLSDQEDQPAPAFEQLTWLSLLQALRWRHYVECVLRRQFGSLCGQDQKQIVKIKCADLIRMKKQVLIRVK